ncbi:MAG: hypothetical protein Q4D36_00245 [Bacteroidales bacterium]|nr:hypothetical protein [Bacteroidales bacterium]
MNKLFILFGFVVSSLLLAGCGDGDKNEIVANDLIITAVNLTNNDNAVTGGISVNISTSITINGEESVSVTKVSNELFVSPGDEVQITYTPSNGETEVYLTLPDGEHKTLDLGNSTLKWIVPNISSGNITAVSYSSDDDAEYTHTGTIKLIFDF